ncbi:MAG TPA: hypothetical protein VJY39_21610 [Acidisphaera sp.]|nr:hypothetical protein [Acidisphaera sp.]
MWRYALLGLTLLLPGCATFGDFLGDTFTYDTNPNRPVGDSENMKRVEGKQVPVGPLLPEPGDVWPTQIEAVPTLQELEKQTNQGLPAPALTPEFAPLAAHAQPRPGAGAAPGTGPSPTTPAPSITTPSPTLTTPSGPQAPATGGSGLQTIPPSSTSPGGIVVPNGNGTSTLISPNGTVTTIPTPGK